MDEVEVKQAVLQAALVHVPFDGWSEVTFRAAVADSGVAPGLARALFPRGGVDLALAYHAAGDAAMAAQLASEDLSALRFSERIAHAVLLRLELADREAVRRGSTLFALPQHAAEGAKALWSTADAIWTALGDSSEDVNWYTKRATLAAVYGATVLFWLGDDSTGLQATRDFLSRRIEGVMRFEKLKADVGAHPLGRVLMAGPMAVLGRISRPRDRSDLPGRSSAPRPF